MRSLLTYTAARLGLFAAAFGVVYLFGARSWVAIILAWLISGLASYVLLSTLRDQVSTQAVERMERRKNSNVGARLEGGAAREDHLQEDEEDPSAQDVEKDEDTPGGNGAKGEEGKIGQDTPTTVKEP